MAGECKQYKYDYWNDCLSNRVEPAARETRAVHSKRSVRFHLIIEQDLVMIAMEALENGGFAKAESS